MDLSVLAGAQALRATVELVPIDGPGGRIFPPTYPPEAGSRDKAPPRHVVEELPSGQRRVLIDSVASQANRQEAALVAARADGRIDFADIYVDLSGTEAGIDRLSATELPHRLADAILRDSEIDGVVFAQSTLGRRLLASTPADLSPLLETSPSSLLFGCWFAQAGQARPLKIQRATTSEIWADDAVLGQAVGSRIDPLGIEKVQLYVTASGDWTALADKAAQKGDKPKPYGKRPSEINHGNIAPSIRQQGITAASIKLRWAMPLAALRRLHFGGGERDAAGQAYVLALGVLARVLDHAAGYSLRSRCDLLTTGAMTMDMVDGDGAIQSRAVRVGDAIAWLHQAEQGMRQAGLGLHGKVTATPGTKLVDLIRANRAVRELDADGEE